MIRLDLEDDQQVLETTDLLIDKLYGEVPTGGKLEEHHMCIWNDEVAKYGGELSIIGPNKNNKFTLPGSYIIYESGVLKTTDCKYYLNKYKLISSKQFLIRLKNTHMINFKHGEKIVARLGRKEFTGIFLEDSSCDCCYIAFKNNSSTFKNKWCVSEVHKNNVKKIETDENEVVS